VGKLREARCDRVETIEFHEKPAQMVSTSLDLYRQAASRLDELIELTPPRTDLTPAGIRARAEQRMGRLRRFLDQLGDPLSGYPIVHIGGTSGKGSTSSAIAAILQAAGYRTGLHTSPYLQVPTEKLQLNGQLISADTYTRLTNDLLAEHETWKARGEEGLTYGEAWIALMALYFRDQKVDIAVVEVGAGGRFDLTNLLTPVLSVITSVGIDHTNTLGSTLEEIAWHKAGIIKPGVPSISAVTAPAARRIMAEEAEAVGSDLLQIDADRAIRDVRVARGATSWTDSETGESFSIGLAGSFQAQNGNLAVAIARRLRESGFSISDEAIDQGLRKASIPGRAEYVPDVVTVLLDGAHNRDKIEALAKDIPFLLPVPEGGRRIAVIGALEAKQTDEMLALLAPHVDTLVATSPQVLAKASREASALADTARNAGFGTSVFVEPDPKSAIIRAIELARPESGDAVLVTGSLYLVGNIRERWYRSDDIVETQSSWPATARSS
jgi:dihydrofolate synthase/folylpolyglutamate synthase